MEQRGVLFGVDYYPEQWPASLWEPDMQRMVAAGFQAIRVMEFAWSILEPEEGRYDFSLFDQVLDLAHQHGLKVVLGTPTATFPPWLYAKDPQIVQMRLNGERVYYGRRREGCYNSPTYQAAACRIVTAVAEHFASHPAVVGWQIDNEIGHEGSDRCICPNCQAAWSRWLAGKYQTPAQLNQAWGAVFWGRQFNAFEQVPVPARLAPGWHNPGLALDYDRFCSDSAVHFANTQVDILRARIPADRWITTNLYISPHSAVTDSEQLVGKMDFAAYDNYPVWGDQDEPLPYYFNAYALSHMRGLKEDRPFSIFEQMSGIQGHTTLGYLPPDQQVVLWTHQAVALGADQVFYFRWRTAPYGQEQLCYGLLDPDNQDTSRFTALTENMRRSQPIYQAFASQPYPAEACLVYDKDNSRLLKEQFLTKGIFLSPQPFMQVGYDMELARSYAPFSIFNVNADVKSAQSVDLSRYKLVSLPLYEMADPAFAGRLADWVRAGGHLILGWRAGARDRNNFAVPDLLPGPFAEMAGVNIRRFESLNNTKVGIRIGMLPSQGEIWADLLEPTTARPLAHYTGREKHYRGTPCITANSYGKGVVYYMGTSLGPTGIFLFYRRILKPAGLNPRFHGIGIEVIRRKTANGGHLDLILNHTPKARRVRGQRIPPYGLGVVEDR